MTMPKTIVVLGKTGSGKGTQAQHIAEKLGYKVFSTGDRFRELMQQDSLLGRKVRELEKGVLMPHWFASYLFEEFFLNVDEDAGVVTEGVGRTKGEAEMFDEVMDWLEREYVVLELQVSDASVIERQIKRGRSDSNTKEKLQTRLDEYQNKTAGAIAFFKEKGKLIEINGELPIEDVFSSICKALAIS